MALSKRHHSFDTIIRKSIKASYLWALTSIALRIRCLPPLIAYFEYLRQQIKQKIDGHANDTRLPSFPAPSPLHLLVGKYITNTQDRYLSPSEGCSTGFELNCRVFWADFSRISREVCPFFVPLIVNFLYIKRFLLKCSKNLF